MKALTFHIETVGQEDPWNESSYDVAALFCNGVELWRDTEFRYVDTWGDGGTQPEEVVLDMLKKVFKNF